MDKDENRPMSIVRWHRRPSFLATLLLLAAASAAGADTVAFRSDGRLREVEGNVIGIDSRQTVLFEGRDTQHYLIDGRDVVRLERSKERVPLYTLPQLREQLAKELGDTFQFLDTRHYLVCYSCSPEYARDASALLERAYAVFTNYFRRKGDFPFVEPKQPMIVLIHRSREDYVRALSDSLGPLAPQTAGVFLPQSNRMFMFDAFGGRTGRDLATASQYSRRQASGFALMLRHQNVQVVVHEAIHQIAFNVGFHNRQVELPLWLVEGMAMFFEAPDLDARGGWKGVGEINHERVATFRESDRNRSPDFLRRLVVDDGVLRDPRTAITGYSEAWALTYFLAKTKRDEYAKYLKLVNARSPMRRYTADERLAHFREAFGADPSDLQPDLLKYMTRVVYPRSSAR